MTNKRRLGRLRLLHDPEQEPPVSKLGFDVLIDPPTSHAFLQSIAARKISIKGLLLDQSFAAGVGNWIADEVLYQAKVDPRRRAGDLTATEGRRVLAKLLSVVGRAVEVDADKSRFPKNWLFHHRWGKPSEATTNRGDRIEVITVAGRTTAWVPSAQR